MSNSRSCVMQVSLIVEILHNSFTLGVGPNSRQLQHLSHAPETVAARFRSANKSCDVYPVMWSHHRLLSIAVTALQENLISNTLERTVIREKAYNTALDYFAWVYNYTARGESTVSLYEQKVEVYCKQKFKVYIQTLKTVELFKKPPLYTVMGPKCCKVDSISLQNVHFYCYGSSNVLMYFLYCYL